ncbi:efflux RND transporter periplasmic adaptor subunit [Methylosinus sp. H3A]|uniref:efflux RND transporter periplasmic adaptor subunit n=1 Tax=Methylosinus sp. H3A TaxID=2785786 RepID=UPI0018C2D04F|nr:efflux RND transporter periplasmic adaptor subunit [Methylosinus sp. H3A]MBG0807891.1 efflux RND transporter periplasmic adaptor subunit [Methylosinus sp. H3A]
MRGGLRFGSLTAAGLALAAAVYAGGKAPASLREGALAPSSPAVTVETAAASAGPLPRSVTAVGSLRAVRQVTLTPEVGGRVVAIHFHGGERIAADMPAIDLYSKPQQAELAQNRAEETVARLQLQRSTELNRHNASSQAEVDNRQAAFDRASAMVAASEAAIAQRTVRAPFSGILGVRNVDLGQYLNPGDAIATLTDLDELFIDFAVPQRYLGDLVVGQTVEIATDAVAKRRFVAKLETIEPQVDRGTRNVALRARIANHDRQMRPGLYATATLSLTPENGVVTVPETAVLANASTKTAFIVRDIGADGEGRVEQVVVETGRRVDSRVAILSGLTDGDIVVTSGQLRLSPGLRVRSVSPRPSDGASLAAKSPHSKSLH